MPPEEEAQRIWRLCQANAKGDPDRLRSQVGVALFSLRMVIISNGPESYRTWAAQVAALLHQKLEGQSG